MKATQDLGLRPDPSSTAARLAASAAELGLSSAQLEGLIGGLRGGPLHLVEGTLKRTLHQAAEIMAANKAKPSSAELSTAAVVAEYKALMQSTTTPDPKALDAIAERAQAALTANPSASDAWLVLGVIRQSPTAFHQAMMLEPALLHRSVESLARSPAKYAVLPHFESQAARDLFEPIRLAVGVGMLGFAPALLEAYQAVGAAQPGKPLGKLGAAIEKELSALPERESIALYTSQLVRVLSEPTLIGNMHLGYSVSPGPRELIGDFGNILIDQLKAAAAQSGDARLKALDRAEQNAHRILWSMGRYLGSVSTPHFNYLSLTDRRLSVFSPQLR